MADVDTIALTDLEVIQQFSLAVRGASAPRAAVIAALEADLAHLRGSGRTARATAPATAQPTSAARAPGKAVAKAPAKKAASRTPAKKPSRSA